MYSTVSLLEQESYSGGERRLKVVNVSMSFLLLLREMVKKRLTFEDMTKQAKTAEPSACIASIGVWFEDGDDP